MRKYAKHLEDSFSVTFQFHFRTLCIQFAEQRELLCDLKFKAENQQLKILCVPTPADDGRMEGEWQIR